MDASPRPQGPSAVLRCDRACWRVTARVPRAGVSGPHWQSRLSGAGLGTSRLSVAAPFSFVLSPQPHWGAPGPWHRHSSWLELDGDGRRAAGPGRGTRAVSGTSKLNSACGCAREVRSLWTWPQHSPLKVQCHQCPQSTVLLCFQNWQCQWMRMRHRNARYALK